MLKALVYIFYRYSISIEVIKPCFLKKIHLLINIKLIIPPEVCYNMYMHEQDFIDYFLAFLFPLSFLSLILFFPSILGSRIPCFSCFLRLCLWAFVFLPLVEQSLVLLVFSRLLNSIRCEQQSHTIWTGSPLARNSARVSSLGLFLLDGFGVPSSSYWVRLRGSTSPSCYLLQMVMVRVRFLVSLPFCFLLTCWLRFSSCFRPSFVFIITPLLPFCPCAGLSHLLWPFFSSFSCSYFRQICAWPLWLYLSPFPLMLEGRELRPLHSLGFCCSPTPLLSWLSREVFVSQSTSW